MPYAQVDTDLDLFFADDCFAAPWLEPDPIVLVHGVGESSAAWYGWVPGLATDFRVLRPDLRGFGSSPVPGPGYPWSPHNHGTDLLALLDQLELSRVHLVGAKYGGAVAAQFAADHPDRLLTLHLMGPLIKGDKTGSKVEISSFADIVQRQGHAGFAVNSQRLRLGTSAPQEQVDWWNEMMARSSEVSGSEILMGAGNADLTAILPDIITPTLVITTDKNPVHGLEWVVSWQQMLPRSSLVVLPGDGYQSRPATRPIALATYGRS